MKENFIVMLFQKKNVASEKKAKKKANLNLKKKSYY